jgi:DMSO/TMAO reductase YedYZ molybdopterin-dependent catalytic subunit
MQRRKFLALSSAAALAGCSAIADKLNANDAFHKALQAPEKLNLAILGAGQPLAREYRQSDVSPVFRSNGFMPPSTAAYEQWMHDGWRGYRLFVSGLVETPQSYDLPQLRAKFARISQTTRHDCVEGWSVIGKWTGARLSDVLADAGPKTGAGFVVFHCLDDDGTGALYYESLSMRQAAHPQVLLAYDLNDRTVPVENGAPLRLKVPTQLGYKSAKYVNRIEVVADLPGTGGYWEDQGYEWFAGI